MTFVKAVVYTVSELNRKYVRNINTRKGGMNIANEIIFTELKFKNVSVGNLAKALGITEQTLMQVLRFELDEQEQLNMLWLINNLPTSDHNVGNE